MKKGIFLLIAAGLLLDSIAYATAKYSIPMGANIVTLNGAVNGVPKVNTFSLALRCPTSSSVAGKIRGALTGVTATTFTDNSAGWDGGALSQAATPYFVRITSGSAVGTWWRISYSTANTATTVTVLNLGLSPIAAGVLSGDTYELVPGDTLSTVFGGIAESIGGIDAASADAVRLHDGVSWHEYHYNTSPGVMQWREGAASFNRNNTVIRPDSGIVYIRKASSNVSLAILGSVSMANEQVTVGSTGVTLVGSVFPVARTLGSFNVQDMPGFVKYTGTMAAADKVTVFDGVSWRYFNYNLSAGQWREGTAPFNRNNFAIPYGSPLILERGTGATGGFVLLSLAAPYSL